MLYIQTFCLIGVVVLNKSTTNSSNVDDMYVRLSTRVLPRELP